MTAKLAKVGASPEAAQLLVDELKTSVEVAAKSVNDANLKTWSDMQKGWQDEVRADPNIGGPKLDASIAATRQGAEALLGDKAAQALYKALNITGAGNHPDVVRALYTAFSRHAPATGVQGSPAAPAPGPKTAGQTLYPNQPGLGNAALQ
jgi:hypothetical protein